MPPKRKEYADRCTNRFSARIQPNWLDAFEPSGAHFRQTLRNILACWYDLRGAIPCAALRHG